MTMMTIFRHIAKGYVGAVLVVACLFGPVAQAGAGEGEQQQVLPPEGSPPLMRTVELKFGSKDGGSSINYDTYLFYMEITNHISSSSQQRWVPYDQDTVKILRGDFYRLWDTGFLDDLSIQVVDDPYPNGVIGKHAIFHLVERPRIRIVTFEGSTAVKRKDIDTAMQDMNVEIRLDSFLDLRTVKRVETLVETMFSANGYQFSDVRHEITSLETGTNAIKLTFFMEEGPKVQVEKIDFIGNEAISDDILKNLMKQIKERWWLSKLTGRGTYKAALFEQDADLIVAHYLDQGYLDVAVGTPEAVYLDVQEDLEPVESLSQLSELAKSNERYAELVLRVARNFGMPSRSYLAPGVRQDRAIRWLWKEATQTEDGTEEVVVEAVNALSDAQGDEQIRLMRLRIPVDEGERYRVGEVTFEGHDVVTDYGIELWFASLRPGEYYSQAVVTAGLEGSREMYGSIGYTDMTIFPDLQRRTAPNAEVDPALDGEVDGEVEVSALGNEGVTQDADPERPTHIDGDPVVDVIIRTEEGEAQLVNRIIFVGNLATHDEVLRREMLLVENGTLSTAALKNSLLRINQLGYFQPLEDDAFELEDVDGDVNKKDLTLNLVEANLNQLSFGAGASQFDGFFGQVSYLTSNFLGRGETLQASVSNGSRLRNINLGYTKPWLFDRNISGGLNTFNRRIEWIGAFTQESTGAGASLGWGLSTFSRMFITYNIEQTGVSNVSEYLFPVEGEAGFDGALGNAYLSPFIADALLLQSGGYRAVSKITPSVRYSTVDHPIFPSRGQTFTASVDLAGVGGTTRFIKPFLEGIWYKRLTSRTLMGFRAQYQHILNGDPSTIPVFERLWLGGEYSMRGFDLRRVGPTVSDVEPNISADSYQGRTIIGGNKSVLLNAEYQFSIAQPVRIIYFFDIGQVQDFGHNFTRSGFKSSTGVELRFFMPMLNIPFRLIYAWNPQRDGVYNDRLMEQEKLGFRFAVGTTF